MNRPAVLLVWFITVFPALGLQAPDHRDSSGSPGTLPEPGERQERLQAARRAKARNPVSTRPGRIERLFLKLDQEQDAHLADGNLAGFYPRLAWIARGSGPAAGVRYWNPGRVRGLDILGSAYHSWNRYQHYDLRFGMIPNRGPRIPTESMDDEAVEDQGEIDLSRLSRFRLYGSARYRDHPSVAYFGIGPNSRKQDRSDFQLKDFQAQATVGLQLSPRFAWVFRTGILRHSLGPGRSSSLPALQEVFTGPDIPGLADPPSYATWSAGFVADHRDQPGAPKQGWFAAVNWKHFRQLGDRQRYSFSEWGLDARAYLPLGAPDRTLALRILGIAADPSDGHSVPFFLLPSLGGSQGMRGFRSFRFRGDRLVQAQAEYRWEASRRLELAVFADTGTVAEPGHRLRWDRLKTDAGIGLRIRSSRSVLLRIDQAWSNEGPRTVIRFGGAF